MAGNSKDIKTLLAALVITVGVAGGGVYWLLNSPTLKSLISPSSPGTTPASPGTTTASPASDVASRISSGDKILLSGQTNPSKEAGVLAIASAAFPAAVQAFEQSLQSNRNDPETLIYLNNAKIGSATALTIAVSVPIGNNVNLAQEILRGVAQAQQEINQAGGIKGTPMRVVIGNDDNDQAVVKGIATYLVSDPSVVAVVGHNSSDASLAAAPIYQAGGLVMISPTATTKELSGFGSYIYRTSLSAPFQANALSRLAKSRGKTNIGICYSASSDASKSLKEEFTEAAYGDGAKISRVDCNLSAPGFNAETLVSTMLGEGVDALLLNPGVDDIERSLDVAKASQGRLLLLSDSTLYTIKTLEIGKADVIGMVLTVPWHPQARDQRTFAEDAIKLWGGNVNWRSATSYDAVQAIAAGLGSNPTRAGLQQALANPDFVAEGATGTIQFQPSGDRITTPLFVTVEPSANSASGYTFTPIAANAQP
ncbi:MAG TPA: ABC transporter substrate-binding protein [Chroococcidiopsis sp.]